MKRWKLTAGVALILLIPGCGGTDTTTERSGAKNLADDALYSREKDFDPARYDPDVPLIEAKEQGDEHPVISTRLLIPALPETISGFRVQIFLTEDIDEANRVRDSIMNSLTEEWAYIIYDAPYYKVRVGNYTDRTAANHMTRRLTDLGFPESWVVPDKILKHPPPRLSDVFVEPRRVLDNGKK